MDRIPITSTTIASAGYDDATRTLEVEFRSGIIYRYFDVPGPLYRRLVAADSPGGFFNRWIRDSYRHQRM